MMEVKQIIIYTVTIIITGTMSYLIGNLQGFLKGMEKVRKIYEK